MPTCGLTRAIWLNSGDPILNLKTSTADQNGLSFWWGAAKVCIGKLRSRISVTLLINN